MAIKANLVIDQGSTFASSIELLDQNDEGLDVSGFTARGQLRKHYTSTNSVSFSTGLANGTLVISLTANQTANIVSGRYVYDIELVDGTGTVTRILEGIVTVTPEVTRA
jgi:hypothetical protein